MPFSKLIQTFKNPRAIREMEARGLISAEEAAQREAELLPIATREEAEVAQDVAGSMGQAGQEELQKGQDLYYKQAFQGTEPTEKLNEGLGIYNKPKSAEESAAMLAPQENLPAVQSPRGMVPYKDSTSQPNFTMGENYIPDSSLVPAPIPGFPEIQGTKGASTSSPLPTNLEKINRPDVIDAEYRTIPDQTSKFQPKDYVKAAAALGLAGTGAYALSGGGDANKPKPPIPNAEVTPVQIQPEAAPKESAEITDLRRQLALLSKPAAQENKLIDVDFGQNSTASREELGRLQGERNKNVFYNQLGKAFSQIGGGISGASNIEQAGKIFDENIKTADQPIADYKARIEMEKDDPNSAASQGLRKLYATMGINVKGAGSFNELAKLSPTIAAVYDNKLKTQALKDAHAQALAQRIDAAKEKQAINEEKSNTKRFDDLNKKLVSELASSRTTFGVDAKTLQGVQNVKALIQGKDPNDLDNREVYEVAKVLDRILSQGAPTISGSAKLTPDTARMHVAKYLELVTNKRHGAQAGDFINRFSKTLDREEDQAKNRIQATQGKLLASYADLKDKDPEKWNLLFQMHNLPEDLIAPRPIETPKGRTGLPQDKTGLPKTLQKKAAPMSGQPLKPDDVDNMTDEEIAAELKKRGIKLPQ